MLMFASVYAPFLTQLCERPCGHSHSWGACVALVGGVKTSGCSCPRRELPDLPTSPAPQARINIIR